MGLMRESLKKNPQQGWNQGTRSAQQVAPPPSQKTETAVIYRPGLYLAARAK